MKEVILLFVIVFVFFSCNKMPEVYNQPTLECVKDSLLYKDNKGNIYLKHRISIIKRRPQEPVIRYFDAVSCEGVVYDLEQLADITTFKQVSADLYSDKNYDYIFDGHPNTFPNIRATKKVEKEK